MTRPEQLPQSREAIREIFIAPGEMIAIAEMARVCINSLLEDNDSLVSDHTIYTGIPHDNSQRSYDFRMATQDTRFSSIDLDISKTEEDVPISIKAHAIDLPGRTVTFDEVLEYDGDTRSSVEVDDTYSLAIARAGRHTIAPTMSTTETAEWLYLQAGLDSIATRTRAHTESNPILDACQFLTPLAKQTVRIRQVSTILYNNVTMHGQVVEDINTDYFVPLRTRRYSAWINTPHKIASAAAPFLDETKRALVTERLLVEFSPDDLMLISDESTVSRAQVTLETLDPNLKLGSLIVNQAINYEDGGILDAFSKAHQYLSWQGKQSA